MILDILYKRGKQKQILYWRIKTDGNMIMKESGQLETLSPITHNEFTHVGKQKRTPAEQAEFQAHSNWTKKHDEGYKSLEDLGIASRVVGNGPIRYMYNHLETTLLDGLQKALPQFNTDATGNVKPMLAKTVNWDKVVYPCLVQPKLDGVRCLMVVQLEADKDSSMSTVTFLSRNGKEYNTLGHIAATVQNYLLTLDTDLQFILDGEIYNADEDELTFQEIVSAVKAQKPNSLKLKFRAYDIVSDKNQRDRWKETEDIVKSIQSPFIQLVKTFTVYLESSIKLLHAVWAQKGYEGVMIRLMDGIYDQGQRSSSLLKVKEFDETEFELITFEKGKRDEDLIAVCKVKAMHTDEDQEFRAKMVGNVQQKQDLWKDGAKLSGTLLTVKHFGWTDSLLPRFPIGKSFRNYE